MTDGSPSADGPTADARAIARQKARELRGKQRRRDRRNRVLLRTGIVVALVAVVAIVTVVLVTSIRPPHRGPANMASDGVMIGAGLKAERSPARAADAKPTPHALDTTGQVVNITTYVDYLCQYCGQFERTNNEQIRKLVDSGAATLEIHPLPFYANRSAQGTQYSLRASNAAACVANYSPDSFFDFNRLMFEHEPGQTTAGLTDARITAYAKQAGAQPMSSIKSCITNRTYENWAQAALDRASTGPLPNSEVKKVTADSLPLVLVDGQRYTGSVTEASDFRAFIQQAQGERYATPQPTDSPEGTSSPSPTPTPTTIVVG
ncbi:thioredoxin domain-containing protein [Gryllotalpicola daejeonensis]|jgi:protein-disulfide isomerase|uniref:Thioredoxin domain-containing protein n=1 Tax=Gryllotalpicola daejeonensis TaxID=993087 RepID=A0ABP7ZJ60_9MICO